MRFKFEVEVEVSRTQGKFAGRDEIETAITDALDGAALSEIQCDGGGEYNVDDWTVSAVAIVKPKPVRRAKVLRLRSNADGSHETLPELAPLARVEHDREDLP